MSRSGFVQNLYLSMSGSKKVLRLSRSNPIASGVE